jgi:hypothetical protein
MTLPEKLRHSLLQMVISDADKHDMDKALTRKSNAKMNYMAIVNEIMPGGQPDYLGMIRFPKITDLVQEQGQAVILLVLSVMVRDFCATLNVVRNMNDDQIVEVAAMMLVECGTFRMEDYATFFAMAKKGQLGQIRDRIDMQVITELLDQYFARRRDAAIELQEREIERQEAQLPVQRVPSNPMDDKFMSVGGALSEMRSALADKIGTNGKKRK